MPFVSPVCGAFNTALFVELPVAFTEPLLFVFGVFFEDSVTFSPFSLCYYFFLYVLKFINVSYFLFFFIVYNVFYPTFFFFIRQIFVFLQFGNFFIIDFYALKV